MGHNDEMSIVPAPANNNVAVQTNSITEEEYLDATCTPSTQSCPLSHREHSRINRRCLYQLFKVWRIKKDGSEKLLFTFQAQSRDPGNMAFYAVSAPKSMSGHAQLKCSLTGITGPCSEHHLNRNWQYNRNIVNGDIIERKTTSELILNARTDEIGNDSDAELVKILRTFWIPEIRPKGYRISTNFCGGVGRTATLHVYPDVKWEITLKGTWENNEGSETANVRGLEFSVKVEYGAAEYELKTNYQRIVDNFNSIVHVIKKVVEFFESKKKPTAGASERRRARGMSEEDRQLVGGSADTTDGQVAQGLAAQGQISEGFEVEWPDADITLKWGWKESHQIEYCKKAEYKWDLTASVKFFKLTFSLEILGPLLNTIPGAGPFLAKLQDLGEDTGLLTLTVMVSASSEVKADLTWKQTYNKPDSKELNVGGSLHFELTVQATLSTRLTSGGHFGWQAEFGAGLEGSATTGITFSLERELWKAEGEDLKGSFKIKFDGITITGIAYIEYGLSHSENEDGRANRRESNVDTANRNLANTQRAQSSRVASIDQNEEAGNRNSDGTHRRARRFTYVLLHKQNLYRHEFKFN